MFHYDLELDLKLKFDLKINFGTFVQNMCCI